MRAQRTLMVMATALVLSALALLSVRVSGEPEVAVSEEDLSAALRRYERAQAMRTATGVQLRRLRAEARAEAAGMGLDDDEPAPIVDRRSTPSHAPDLHRNVTDFDLAERLNNVHVLYRNRDYKGALEQAKTLLNNEAPDNAELRRVIVRAACIEGNRGLAQAYLNELSDVDRPFLLSHCERYGVELE